MNGNETIELNGALGIGENAATIAVDVAVRNVDLVELDKLLLQNRGLRGTLNGDAKITGTLKAPVVDGHPAVTGGGFQGFSYQSLDVKANYAPAIRHAPIAAASCWTRSWCRVPASS